MTLIGIGSANNMERKTEEWQNGTPTTITRACYVSFSLDESKVSLLAMPSLMYSYDILAIGLVKFMLSPNLSSVHLSLHTFQALLHLTSLCLTRNTRKSESG